MIDQVTRGDRDANLQDILNTLDGGDTKDMNVIALFTTNHIELIEPTFLRGKRIGSIITMPTLDAITAKKYVDNFFNGYKMVGDFDAVYSLIEKSDIAPAFMAEIIENVKSNMVVTEEEEVNALNLLTCVESYLRQVDLAKTKDMSETPAMRLQSALADALGINETKQAILERMEELVG